MAVAAATSSSSLCDDDDRGEDDEREISSSRSCSWSERGGVEIDDERFEEPERGEKIPIVILIVKLKEKSNPIRLIN